MRFVVVLRFCVDLLGFLVCVSVLLSGFVVLLRVSLIGCYLIVLLAFIVGL